MESYAILRDLSRRTTAGPFEAMAAVRADLPGEMQVEIGGLDKADVRDLARDPQVQAIAPIMPTTLVHPVAGGEALTPPATAAAAGTWGVTAVRADVSTQSGAGVTVAVLDTGIDADHPAFAGVTLVEEDFTGSGNGDKQGHGTHCAGTVFGREVDGTRIGVAPGVGQALIGKILGDDGTGDTEGMFRGIQWAVQQGAQVVSMSVEFDFPGSVKRRVDQGWPADLATSVALEAYRANLRMFDALLRMIASREAFGAGTVVVAAAGNGSRRESDPGHEIGVALPAAAEGVVSVAAVGQSGDGLRVADFSNTFAQISAPGVGVQSAKVGGGLRSLNGTSMAAPHVAGVAALWWERVLAAPVPAKTAVVLAKLLATAATDGFAAGTDVVDRGVGLVQAP
jgi:subtilisin family serine protease